ncbi:MAG: beta strand repeat-containing protein, partial [Acidobacteriota bacterium]
TTKGNELTFEGSTTIDDANDILVTAVNPSADRTYTLPDLGTNGTFAFLEGAQTFSGTKTFNDLAIADANVTLNGGNTVLDITGAGTRTLSLLNSTASQIADLDLADGGLFTAGTSRLTNAGALENITGYTQTSGNFAISGTGTFSTGTGTVSLNGNTTIAGTLAVNGDTITSDADLTITAAGGNIITGNALNVGGGTFLTPSGTADVTIATDADSSLFISGLTNVTGSLLCVNGSDAVGTCANSAVSLQTAYDGGNGITTTDARDIDFVLDDTTTDSNFDINIIADNTVSISREDGSSSEAPDQLLLLENLDTNLTIADGLLVNVASGGVISDGLDVSDSDIVNAVNVGANTILGTTATIDFSNFDLAGNGNLTTAGDIAVNGGDLTTSAATGNLFSTNATTVNIGGAATTVNIGTSTGTTTINNDAAVAGAATVTGTLSANGDVALGNAASDTVTVNGTTTFANDVTFSPAGTTDITFATDSDSTIVLNGLQTANGSLLCADGANNLVLCDTAVAGLQSSYDAGNTIATTDARDIAFTLDNTITDSNFVVTTATDATGYTVFQREDGAGNNAPSQLMLIDNQDTDLTQPTGLKIQSAAGGITTAIDVSDADIV